MDLKINHMDKDRLFTKQEFVDPEAGTLILIQSVTDGSIPDRWRGEVALNGMGPQPVTVQFDIIGASSMETAISLWVKACEKAVKECVESMRSQAIRSAIIAPAGKAQ